jgi:Integrase core domain
VPRTHGSELRWRTGRTLPDAALAPHLQRIPQPFYLGTASATSLCTGWRISARSARSAAKDDSYDNAAADAVNSLYKKELVNHEGPWQDAGQVTVATAEWVAWYNEDRLHSACGNIPPAEYENAWISRKGHTMVMPEAKAS